MKKTPQKKRPEETLDYPENIMADTPRIDDDTENIFDTRKLDQPNPTQSTRPRAISIYNQGKPPVVKHEPVFPLGISRAPSERNYHQSPYGYPPQMMSNIGYQHFGRYPDVREFQQPQIPRPIHTDYEDPFVDNNMKIPRQMLNPEHLQLFSTQQQQQFRPPNYSKSRKIALKQSRPYTVTSSPLDYELPELSINEILEQARVNEEIPLLATEENMRKSIIPTSLAIADLLTLLGCRDKDPVICAHVTEESCRARPGFYLKLCPVKCKNCNGLICMDSSKVDCQEVHKRGGCRLSIAAEYCPKTCNACPTPAFITEQQSPCRDELDTCEQLAESGVVNFLIMSATPNPNIQPLSDGLASAFKRCLTLEIDPIVRDQAKGINSPFIVFAVTDAVTLDQFSNNFRHYILDTPELAGSMQSCPAGCLPNVDDISNSSWVIFELGKDFGCYRKFFTMMKNRGVFPGVIFFVKSTEIVDEFLPYITCFNPIMKRVLAYNYDNLKTYLPESLSSIPIPREVIVEAAQEFYNGHRSYFELHRCLAMTLIFGRDHAKQMELDENETNKEDEFIKMVTANCRSKRITLGELTDIYCATMNVSPEEGARAIVRITIGLFDQGYISFDSLIEPTTVIIHPSPIIGEN
ncbi:hypothetical protein FO519_000566 [Halicephalobus sp. NKZ332]|nr:hypothetical protein FO519_000566 [Halicephalobus sp. NKZ332]